jgi:hypothetical protein
VTDIDILTPLSYPLKWYWSRDYVDVTIHNTEQDFLMFEYMINIIWYGSFRITSCINPQPISSLELKLSGWYWCLGLILDVIRKEPYNILYVQFSESRYYFINMGLEWVHLTFLTNGNSRLYEAEPYASLYKYKKRYVSIQLLTFNDYTDLVNDWLIETNGRG